MARLQTRAIATAAAPATTRRRPTATVLEQSALLSEQ
jgi:hypothetical protein